MLDLVTLSIALGLVVCLLFAETLGKTAGGLVVPGYLALYLTRPVDIALTLAAALAAFGFVRAVSSWTIVYGKRRTVLMLLAGFATGAALREFVGAAGMATDGAELTVIGYIVPGLIAIWFDRQGCLDTCATTLTAAAVVRLALVLLVPDQLQMDELQRRGSEPIATVVQPAADGPHALAETRADRFGAAQ